MKLILKWKWLIVAIWVAAAALLINYMPDMEQLVREKGQASVPERYSSKQAERLIRELNGQSENANEMSVVAVFYSEDKLNTAQMDQIETGIQALEQQKLDLGIRSILSPGNEDMKEQLRSKDGTTALAVVTVDIGNRSKEEIRNLLMDKLEQVKVEHYLTGSELIMEDFVKTTQAGVKKTEGVAVVFIIVVLILIFRSPVTPIISLVTVGITFLISLGTVTQLVDKFNFPFSGFTQIFLILVLFGIGTDYIILLFMRFKEELSRRETTLDAIIHTYKTAGRTVLYSGVAVLIGFSSLGLAEFQLFKSASAVGIGVGILLLALFTIVPIFMGLLGRISFWPSKATGEHNGNKLISGITGFAVKRPIWGILITIVIAVPISLFYSGHLSYNSLDEIKDSYPSVKGIHIVYDHFPAGQASPTTVVMKAGESLDSSANLAFIDSVTEQLTSIDGVDKVFSATRPHGEKIKELYTSDQSASLSEGIGKANDGIGTIKDGLSGAVDQLATVPLDQFNKVNDLVTGTKKVQEGMNQSIAALNKISAGLDKGTVGAGELKQGLHNLNGNLAKLNESTATISSGLPKITEGYNTLYTQYDNIKKSLDSIIAVSKGMNDTIGRLEESNGDLKNSADFLVLKSTSAALSEQLTKLSQGMNQLNQQFNAVNGQLVTVKQGMQQIQLGQKKIRQGSAQLEDGAAKLQEGLAQGSAGQKQVTSKMPALAEGMSSIVQGQVELNKGLSNLASNLPQLKNGLGDSVKGLEKISDGLTSTTRYLNEVVRTGSSETFFIPEQVRTGATFAKSLDTYMSPDRHEAQWTILLKEDPYSSHAMETVQQIQERFDQLLQQSEFAKAEYGIGGISAQNQDLNTMSTGDFTKTAVIMLIGIFIFLMIITRSFWIPLGAIISLVLAYLTALAATEWIFGTFTTHKDLTWTIPFFSFIMIIALGVDYSIFLIMRYLEYKDWNPRQAIYEAMKHTGGVIISAVFILSGTFAAMIPSGVLTLLQLATAVIIALALLALLLLPLFLPAFISLSTASFFKKKTDH
ncbi:MMPL family transporter [Paenibacillus sp. GCM10012306]|uniref:MMPL/RND family transporter n=1 Tax=Paenibacillus sp. GCM10012306 TaxID=3317342 RepID=UPI00361CD618